MNPIDATNGIDGNALELPKRRQLAKRYLEKLDKEIRTIKDENDIRGEKLIRQAVRTLILPNYNSLSRDIVTNLTTKRVTSPNYLWNALKMFGIKEHSLSGIISTSGKKLSEYQTESKVKMVPLAKLDEQECLGRRFQIPTVTRKYLTQIDDDKLIMVNEIGDITKANYGCYFNDRDLYDGSVLETFVEERVLKVMSTKEAIEETGAYNGGLEPLHGKVLLIEFILQSFSTLQEYEDLREDIQNIRGKISYIVKRCNENVLHEAMVKGQLNRKDNSIYTCKF